MTLYMSKRIWGLLFLVFLAGTMFAQTPFDGTWIANLDTAKLSTKPHVYLLDKGMFQCFSCVPKIDVKADGEDQKVMGSHYIDAVTIRVVDDRTVEETDKREGKTVLTMTRTVSSDGKTLTDKFEDDSEAKAVTGEETYRRVSPGPAGSQALSGSWREEKLSNMSSNGITLNYVSTPDGLKMSDTNGVSYDAKFDGKSYLTIGDPGHTVVTLRRLDPNTIDETDKRDGKIVGMSHMVVSPDGKSMKIVFTDKERGTTSTFVLEKKS
jgi:hypothetical protein